MAATVAAITLASLLGCRDPGERTGGAGSTPTAVPPTATVTVSPMPVETSPAPSIYDRTPGVLHEELGTRRPRRRRPGISPSRTPTRVTPTGTPAEATPTEGPAEATPTAESAGAPAEVTPTVGSTEG